MSRVTRLLMVPRVAWLGAKAPRNAAEGWDRYWRTVRSTGPTGDVLWDAGSAREFDQYQDLLTGQLDPDLPIVDVGCGHGSFTARLAPLFPLAIGTDRSAPAIDRARIGQPGLRFEVIDATSDGAFVDLADELGEANVFVRGVLHVLRPTEQVALAENLLTLLGRRGRVLLAETDHRGSALAYLEELGATARGIPRQLSRAINHLPRPGAFGPAELARSFPSRWWTVLQDRPITIDTVPVVGPAADPSGAAATEPRQIPGYCAVLAPRT